MKWWFIFLLPGALFSQNKWEWGAAVGFESQNLEWQRTKKYGQNEPETYDDRPKIGASVAGVVVRRLSENWSLRAMPGLAFNQNGMNFPQEGMGFYPKNYRFWDVDVPVHVCLTNPSGHFPLRGSLLLGGRFSQNLFENGNSGIEILPTRWAIDLGLGVFKQLRWCKFQPEVVYSFGMNNIHDATHSPVEWKIGKMVRDRLTIRVLFFDFKN